MSEDITTNRAKAVIKAMLQLETALDALDQAETGATARFFGDGLRAGIAQARGKRGFYPALYGDKPRPTAQEKALQIARDAVKRLEARLKELRGQNKRSFFSDERPPKGLDDVINQTQEQLDYAISQLAHLEGRTDEIKAAKRAEAEAQLKAEGLAFAHGVAAQQARAKALTNGPK